MLSELSTWLYI